VAFTINGTPRPAGSKKAYPIRRKDGKLGVAVTDAAGKKGREWRQDVRDALLKAYGERKPLDGAVELIVTFHMPRPKAHFLTRGRRDDAPQYHTVKPDATKLLRAIEDAMTGIVWHDDSQVAIQSVKKIYADGRHGHVNVVVVQLT
jgi:Holliday junction resolvase RusA-like endonuclease